MNKLIHDDFHAAVQARHEIDDDELLKKMFN